MSNQPVDQNEDLYGWMQEEDPEPAKSARLPSNTLIMVETAFMASASSLLWLIDYYFPFGPFLRILFPLPIALLYIRCGQRSAWMAVLVSGLLLSILMGPPRSIIFVIPFGLIGVQLGACWRLGVDWTISILLGSLLSAIGFFFRFWLFSIMLSQDLWRFVINQVTGFLQWIFINLGILEQPNSYIIQICAIGLVFLNGFIYLVTVHIASYLIFERMKQPMPSPPIWLQIFL